MTVKSKKYRGVFYDNKRKLFYSVELGRDPIDGHRVTKKGRSDWRGKPFETEKEAFNELERVRAEYNKKHGKAVYKLTFEQFYTDYFMPSWIPTVSHNTLTTRLNCDKRTLERFGNVPIENISTADCEKFKTYLKNMKKDNGEPYAIGTIHDIYMYFQQVMDYADRLHYITNNPTQTIGNVKNYRKKLMDGWEIDEFEKFLNVFKSENFDDLMYGTLFHLYGWTGERASETVARKWEDVDFENKTIMVNSQVVEAERPNKFIPNPKYKQRYIKNHTKSESGMRPISLDEVTLEKLQRWKQIQEIMEINNGLIFHDNKGKILRVATVRDRLKKYCVKAGVTVISLKGLRKTHASYLVNVVKISDALLAQRMGHSDPSTTHKYYAYLYKNAGKEVADKIDEINKIKDSPAKGIIKLSDYLPNRGLENRTY
ncbi:MAG: site-specific integrase [Lactococcus hircilactis]